MAVNFDEDPAWTHLAAAYPALTDVDLVRFTLELRDPWTRFAALVDSVCCTAQGGQRISLVVSR